MRMVGPKVSIEAAQASALRLVPQLDTPSALEYLAPGVLKAPGATLCRPSMQRPVISTPTALFSQMKLSISDVPEEYLPAYTQWMTRVARAQEFSLACLDLDCAAHQGLIVKDPIVAGLLLYLSSADVSIRVREGWRNLAMRDPAGAWLAAEGLHMAEERETLLDAVESDSRLLWWTSQISGFGRAAVKHARTHLDLYGGLALTINAPPYEREDWLRLTCLAGCERPEAACAALVLQPTASQGDKACWLSSLQSKKGARYAYETARWARCTWPRQEWESLKNALVPYAVEDGGRFFFHFYRDVDPGLAASALGGEGVDPLWGAELLDAVDTADEYAFRYKLGERLGTLGNVSASLVLDWLNHRSERKSNGTR
jgi:hypothetical protein